MPQPMPAPTLDGNPPSPPGLNASPAPTMSQLTPGAQMGGSMQVAQMFLQAGGQVAKILDLMGQISPSFAPTASMIIEQLKGSIRTTLQQGMQGSESIPPSMGALAGAPGAQAPSGPAQAGPPMLPSGMGQ